MRFKVEKKRYLGFLAILAVPAPLIIIIISTFWSRDTFGTILLALLILVGPFYLVILAVTLFVMGYENATISFEDESVKCIFLIPKKVKRSIAYTEIKEYGTFDKPSAFYKPTKYIYISCLNRLENHKMSGASNLYGLYRNSSDSIILEYRDEVMELLKNKCPDIMPQ